MDNKNDSNDPRKGQLSKGLINIEESLLKTSSRDLYIYKKSEKICTAIHLVTNSFGEKEPIKVALREKSIDLISLPLSILSVRIMEIKSLLQTAYYTRLISDMNFGILRQELEDLLMLIENKREPLFDLTSDFLHVANIQSKESTSLSIGQSIGHINSDSIYRGAYLHKPHHNSPLKGQMSFSPVQKNHFENSERSTKVLSLLRDGKELTIKDFSGSIKGCSEKTLQRELLKLVAEGKILKKGERRWSKYSLK